MHRERDNEEFSDLDDADAFQAAMQDVVPLGKEKDKVTQREPREVTDTHLARRDAAEGKTPDVDPNFLTLAEVPPVEPLAYLEWRKDGVQLAVYDKLRHAEYPIEGSLDLH